MTSLPPDYIVDRRNLRRKLSFWRVIALGAVLLGIVIAGLRITGGTPGTRLIPHIARLSIEGVITGDKDTLKLIDDIGNSHASAVLIEIESPGGTTTGAERLYDALRRLAKKKPLVSVIGTVGASGAISRLSVLTRFSPKAIRLSAPSAFCSKSPMYRSFSTRSACRWSP